MEFQIDPDWIVFTIGVFSAGIGFVVYHFICLGIAKWELASNSQGNNYKFILLKRALGFLIFGIIPSLLFLIFTNDKFSETGFSLVFSGKIFLWVLLFSVIIIPMNYFNAKSEQNLKIYPEIRAAKWPPSLMILSALSWIAYLLAYEFLFRGILLFPAVELMGFWPAAILNSGLYALVHLPKGAKESLGAIPMGIVLCALAVSTGSFWVSFFIHMVLALSNEWFSLKFHKDIKIVWQR